MNWFVGEYVWEDAKEPCLLLVKLEYYFTNTITYNRDWVYKPAFFGDDDLAHVLGWTAEERARAHAKDIIKDGMTVDDVYYPPHRIREVVFKWGEWVEVEKEVKVTEWEVRPV